MTIAERLAAAAGAARPTEAMRETAERLVLDIAGLCVGARRERYVAAVLDSAEGAGASTVIGHPRALTALDAALVNGTAAHGEDYDDTLEGGPVHAGAVVVPAVLAIAERFGLLGRMASPASPSALRRRAGSQRWCRRRVHKAGFHPTCVFGAIGAALGAGVALRLPAAALAYALGIAGSFASGIIEYLADGS